MTTYLDGLIPKSEFNLLWKELNGTFPSRSIFHLYDLDKDGYLSTEELIRMMFHIGYETNTSYVNYLLYTFGHIWTL